MIFISLLLLAVSSGRDTALISAMSVVASALVTAVIAAGIARRKSSGKVSTSEAADLWTESRSIRTELRDENTAIKKELVDLKLERDRQYSDILSLHERIAILEKEDSICKEKLQQLTQELIRLRQ